MATKIETPIRDFIEKKLVANYNSEPTYKMAPNMKLSFLGSPCIRKIFYMFLRVRPDYGWTFDAIRNFEKGDHLALMLKRWLKDCGLLIDYRNKSGEIPKHWKTKEPDPEFPVNDPALNIKNNKLDGVGVLKGIEGIKDGVWVFELKTINQKGFEDYIIKGPKKEHKTQAMGYVFLLEQNLKEGKYEHIEELSGHTEVQGTIFIYLNRESDKEDWKEFVVPKNEEIFYETAEKIIQTKSYVETNTLPPKTPDFCDWCPFRDKCKKDYKPALD